MVDAGNGPQPVNLAPDALEHFQGLSPDDQEKTVNEMATGLRAAKATAPAADASPTIGGDLKGGLHDLGASVSQGLKVAGGIATRNGLTNVGPAISSAGDTVASYTPDAPAGPAPSELLANDIKTGDWRSGAGHLMHSAIRAAPSTAAILGAGALGGPIAAGGAAAASAIGPLAYARAQNNGRDEPTTGDVVSALPGVAGEALGGALIPGGSKIANPVLRAGAKVLAEGAGGAVMDTAGQLGATVGTDKGASINPAQVAAAAITQGAIGGVRGAGDIAGAAKNAVRDVVSPPPSVDQAASNMRVVGMLKDFKANSGRGISDTDALNSIRTDAQAKLTQFGQTLRTNGAIDATDYSTVIKPVIDMAVRHNKDVFSTPDGKSAWDKLQSLELNADDMQALKDGVTDLSTLSQAARKNRETGPLQKIGQGVGALTSVGLGLGTGAFGGPMGMVAGTLSGLAAKGPAATAAGRIGAAADRLFGLSGPDVVRTADRSQKVLTANGAEAGPSTLQSLSDAQDRANNPPTPAQDAGLGPTARGNAQAAQNQAALIARLGPDHPVGAAALDALGSNPLAEQALQKWNAMAPVREAQAKVQQAAQKSQDEAKQTAQETADRLKRERQQKQSDLEATLGRTARTTNAIDTATTRNEDTLQTADEPPVVPDASLTAVNAAINQAQRRANAVKAQGGDNRFGVPTDATAPASPAETPTAPAAPTPAGTPPEAPQPATAAPQGPTGLLPLQDYIQHGAIARYGASVTPEHIATGLDALAARGRLTPDQYAFYKQSLSSPLQNPGGMHNPTIDALTAHAVAAATGADAPTPSAGLGKPARGADASGVRNPLSYAANLRQEAAIAANIVASHPDVADVVNQIRDPIANAKTAAGRKAVLDEHLDSLDDPVEKARLRAILKPLTSFGKK